MRRKVRRLREARDGAVAVAGPLRALRYTLRRAIALIIRGYATTPATSYPVEIEAPITMMGPDSAGCPVVAGSAAAPPADRLAADTATTTPATSAPPILDIVMPRF
ncbi:hypothetical protein MTP03_04000 [Tsukamurella sp. PLM1]|nr:hypothetical protein MTP03_04000 [Tsukamurella sp. PLM1]